MNTAIIITFHNYESQIDIEAFIEYSKMISNLRLCLVNNSSSDDTFEKLSIIEKSCDNVSTVNIKRFKSDLSAVRAGARFMMNKFNTAQFGFINTNLLNAQKNELSELIRLIHYYQKELIEINTILMNSSNQVVANLSKNQFSLVDYLKKLQRGKLDTL